MNPLHDMPPRPSGNSPEARFFQWVWERLSRGQVRPGPNMQASYTAQGVILEARPGRRGGDCGQRVEVTLCDQDTGETLVYELCGRLKAADE